MSQHPLPSVKKKQITPSLQKENKNQSVDIHRREPPRQRK
jgi:hypothetical protein